MSSSNFYSRIYLFVSAVILLALLELPLVCNGFAATTSKEPKSLFSLGQKSTGNVQIKVFDPKKESASMLQNLQDCRRTAFQVDKQNWLDSERDFWKAQSVIDGKHLCAVAILDGTVVGSADLALRAAMKTNVVMNVFVRPDQRGKGIGKQLMVEGVHELLAPRLPKKNLQKDKKEAIISLDVYTQNKAAIKLYEKLGYTPSSPMHSGTLAMANTLGANLVVTMSKNVPVSPKWWPM